VSGIVKIEINFPVPVEFPDGWEQTLDTLVNMICEKYENEHPERTMWPAGHGSKMLTNPYYTDDLKFDESVYSIDVAEREASEREIERRKQQRA
jgi:hypothetical protein